MNSRKILWAAILVAIYIGNVAAASGGAVSARNIICSALGTLHWLMYSVAGGIAAVIITLQGVKWIGSAEDPGVRKAAKMGIIHAFIGMIIVQAAVWLVYLVTTENCGIANP